MCWALAEQTTAPRAAAGRGGSGRVWAARGSGEGYAFGQEEVLPSGLGRREVRPDAGAPGGALGKRGCVSLRTPGSVGRAGSYAVHGGRGGLWGGGFTVCKGRGGP